LREAHRLVARRRGTRGEIGPEQYFFQLVHMGFILVWLPGSVAGA
jgi:hypothetical protein